MPLMSSDLEQFDQAATALALPNGGKIAFVTVGAIAAGPMPTALRNAAPRRQNTFAAGRRAAAMALQAAGLSGPGVVGLGADGLPVWPTGWLGSISHTDHIAAAIVAPSDNTQLLGLDIEALLLPETAAEIAPQIVPEGVASAGMPFNHQITRAFSAKEALYKALYPHTRAIREFDAARFDCDAQSLILTEDWGDHWPAGARLAVQQALAAGHVLSLVWQQ